MKILVICGAGALGKYIIRDVMAYMLEAYEDIFYFDNNKTLIGTMVSGIEVISERKLVELSQTGSLDIVIATDNWREILEQCKACAAALPDRPHRAWRVYTFG